MVDEPLSTTASKQPDVILSTGLAVFSGKNLPPMSKKKSTKPESESRHGKVPDGWMKQSFQLPEEMGKEFRELGGKMGHGGVKVLGTAAIAFILSLDQSELQYLCDYVRQKTWNDSSELKSENIRRLIEMLIDQAEDAIPVVEPIWYVDKIVDPELSQPPGKKLSDKKRREDRGSA